MIQNLKDLKHMLSLCRKYGVTNIDIGSVKLTLGELPRELETESDGDVPTDELTPEQLMLYSVMPREG